MSLLDGYPKLAAGRLICRVWVAALLAVLVWETLVTLPLERRVVWKSRFTPLTLVYLLNRYWPIASLAGIVHLEHWTGSFKDCQDVVRFMDGSSIATFFLSSLLILVRTWCICDRNKLVLALLW